MRHPEVITITDTLHHVWVLLMIFFGASVFGKSFQYFSRVVVLIFMVSGALTTIESRGLEANLPTPFLGIWERINIGAYMIWVIVFASMLMNRNSNSVSKLKRG